MSRAVVAICVRERLVPGLGWRQDEPCAHRASLGERRLTVWGLFSHPGWSVCRTPRFSRKRPMDETYFVWAAPGVRIRITLTEYPHA